MNAAQLACGSHSFPGKKVLITFSFKLIVGMTHCTTLPKDNSRKTTHGRKILNTCRIWFQYEKEPI